MLYFGVDYYPEHWPEERWKEDARLMAEAGVNVVRLAEFAWTEMESEEGTFDFDWLDRAIAILASRGIKSILGTPTASPPAWLMTAYPECFIVRESGRRATYGCRREYCPNAPRYQELSCRITQKMAEHYAGHPAVVGWQIDNEFGARCFCPICTAAFQEWLQRRYGSLDEVNARWGTVFWSHTYTDWKQIPVPVETGRAPNPGLALDFARFVSDSYVAYQQQQIDIVRKLCPDHFVTHNFMGFSYDNLDYCDLARSLDFVSWDNYIRFAQPDVEYQGTTFEPDPSKAALGHDTMRGLKGQNFWVMEAHAGPCGWETLNSTPRPGEIRLWAYQGIAHGADAIVYFRWRTARFGTEEYWHGLLDHHGIPGRRYREAQQLGGELAKIGDQVLGSTLSPPTGMLLSYDTRFAFRIQPNNARFSYSKHFFDVYRSLHRRQVPVDVVSPTGDLSAYRLLVAPALHVLTEAVAENLVRFVEAGGTLVVTARTGVKDDANAVVNLRLPGLLAELCGVAVEEYDSLPWGTGNQIEFDLPTLASKQARASLWCDVLEPTTATVVARYTQDYYAGKPAITLNEHGKGQVVYVGTLGDADLYDALADWILDVAGVQPILAAPQGVEVTQRRQGGDRLVFLLNHTAEAQRVTLDGQYVDLFEGKTRKGTVTVPARDVLILKER